MKTKTTEQTPLHTPYSLGFQDGYQQGENYYKRSMEWGYPQANESYDQGVEDGQKASRAVNTQAELLDIAKVMVDWLANRKDVSPNELGKHAETLLTLAQNVVAKAGGH